MSTTHPLKFFHLEEILTRKLREIAKISYQSLIEVFKCFQLQWSSIISGKKEKNRDFRKNFKKKGFLGTGKIIRNFKDF